MKTLNEYETPETDANTIWGRACFNTHTYITSDRARNLEQRLAMCQAALEAVANAKSGPHGWIIGNLDAAYPQVNEALEATKPRP